MLKQCPKQLSLLIQTGTGSEPWTTNQHWGAVELSRSLNITKDILMFSLKNEYQIQQENWKLLVLVLLLYYS